MDVLEVPRVTKRRISPISRTSAIGRIVDRTLHSLAPTFLMQRHDIHGLPRGRETDEGWFEG